MSNTRTACACATSPSEVRALMKALWNCAVLSAPEAVSFISIIFFISGVLHDVVVNKNLLHHMQLQDFGGGLRVHAAIHHRRRSFHAHLHQRLGVAQAKAAAAGDAGIQAQALTVLAAYQNAVRPLKGYGSQYRHNPAIDGEASV